MLARKSSVPPVDRQRAGLTARRRRSRRLARLAYIILLLLLLISAVYGLHKPQVRIAHVQISGADPSLVAYATNAMRGYYFGLIPRDSFFFVPEGSIRSNILADHIDVAAVSIARTGLTGLSITTTLRTAVARWCGKRFNLTASSTRLNLVEQCYVFDPNGFIFAPVATSTPILNSFSLYAPLAGNAQEPLRATLANADKLPAVFDFARRASAFGSPVTTIIIRDREIDMYLARPVRDSVSNGASGTRVTYILGDEQNAITALVSTGTNINLTDGSLDYVDLRFDGKVYLKKK